MKRQFAVLVLALPFVLAGDGLTSLEARKLGSACGNGDSAACASWVDRVAEDFVRACERSDGSACEDAVRVGFPNGAWGLEWVSGVGRFDGVVVRSGCAAPTERVDGKVVQYEDCLSDWIPGLADSAAEKGAVAVLFTGLGHSVTSSVDPLLPPVETWGAATAPVPVLGVASWPRPERAAGSVVAGVEQGELTNVLGILPGRGDLASETVVIGAHYDHLGVDRDGRVHPGADDNASGVAAVVCGAPDVARRLEGVASHRRVVFAAFDGEELGMLGSDHYVGGDPLVSEAVVLDMVGHLAGKALQLNGTGSADWLARAASAADAAGVGITAATGNGRSDHAPFLWRSIPSIQLMTGTGPWYHQPEDVPASIDVPGGARVTAFAASLLVELAVGPALSFTGGCGGEGDPYLGMGFRFVDPSAAERGVEVLCVDDGSPAATLGVRRGDRIRAVGDRPVTDAGSLYREMGDLWPWDLVTFR